MADAVDEQGKAVILRKASAYNESKCCYCGRGFTRAEMKLPPLPLPKCLNEVRPLEFRIVTGSTRKLRLWNELITRWHYLEYTHLVGAQMRYAVHDHNGQPLATPGFAAAVWKFTPLAAHPSR